MLGVVEGFLFLLKILLFLLDLMTSLTQFLKNILLFKILIVKEEVNVPM